MICIFDCETIPDTELIEKTFYLRGEPEAISLEAMGLQEQKSGTTFLPLPYHRVVAISAVIANHFGVFEKVNSIGGESEEEMIANFLQFIDRKNPKLVSFNGRNFDIPMLMIRAMKYNLSCPAYFEKENQMLNKSKWDNYRYRYSDRFHVDLMDHIGEFGAARGLNLDTLCAMMDLPGKYDVSGDQVMSLFYRNELEKIREYCESDVLNTYWLYLKYELLKGNMLLEDYLQNLDIMRQKLERDKSYTSVFSAQIEKEMARYDRNH